MTEKIKLQVFSILYSLFHSTLLCKVCTESFIFIRPPYRIKVLDNETKPEIKIVCWRRSQKSHYFPTIELFITNKPRILFWCFNHFNINLKTYETQKKLHFFPNHLKLNPEPAFHLLTLTYIFKIIVTVFIILSRSWSNKYETPCMYVLHRTRLCYMWMHMYVH